MFPSCDPRGKVLGFGARAMRDNQPPKYLNTSDGEIYHKRSQLFGIDRARPDAARAGRMILVEGYTDVLALHQAGLSNAVGIMGTAVTEEQVAELERIVKVLELCLDADRAGQDAMLRAERLAAGRKLELRVVPLPEGSDPAELIERDGPDALQARVESSVPFVVFHVERILDRAELRSAEGRDRALGELQPALAELPASVLRDDLVRRLAGRLELSEGRLTTLVAGGAAAGAGNGVAGAAEVRGALPAIDQEIRAERAFLALCIALPAEGQEVLSAIDPDELLLSGLMRRAARHLINRPDAPLSDLPADDEELARAVADLVALAGRGTGGSPAQLEHARLVLELGRLDRAIRRARGTGTGDVTALARQREDVLEAIRGAVAKLERPL
jgi:DNA primase